MDVDLGAGQRLSLVSVDPSGLDAGARVDALIELQRMRSWVDAQEQVLLAAATPPAPSPGPAPPATPTSTHQANTPSTAPPMPSTRAASTTPASRLLD